MDLDPTEPFRRQAGDRRGHLAEAAARPRLPHGPPGTYVAAATVVTPLLRARAALLPYAGVAWASHASAARVYGLPIPTIGAEHLTSPGPANVAGTRE